MIIWSQYLIQDVGVFKTKFNYKKDGEGNNTKHHIYEKIYLEDFLLYLFYFIIYFFF